MKTKIAVAALIIVSLFSCTSGTAEKEVELNTLADSLSYAVGALVGSDNVKYNLPKLNPDKMREGAVAMLDSTLDKDIKEYEAIYRNIAMQSRSSEGGDEVEKVVSPQGDSLSYAVGALIANDNRRVDMPKLNPDAFRAGAVDFADTSIDLRIAFEDCEKLYQRVSQEAQEREMAKRLEKFIPNKEAGQKFLAENLQKEGVASTPSGLQYRVIKEGNGPKPNPTDMVRVHYTGKLISGEVFDSSVERGQPTEFPLNQVIRGWTEGLSMMNVGSKWELFIPQELAYGIQQKGPMIKPYSALIFEVELLDIVQPEELSKPQ